MVHNRVDRDGRKKQISAVVAGRKSKANVQKASKCGQGKPELMKMHWAEKLKKHNKNPKKNRQIKFDRTKVAVREVDFNNGRM